MTLPGNLRGAALMAAAALLFALEALFIRWMTARGIPITTQLLFRCLGQILWIAPSLIAAGPAVLRTARPLLHGLRGACSLATWGLYYWSLTLLDLATATVLSFTNVMFTTLLAAPLLGERVGAARWAGTLVGLLGIAVMLRPWEAAPASALGVTVALVAAVTWCGITLSSRLLTRTEGTLTIIGWVGVLTTAGILPFALWHWQPLDRGDLALLAGLAAFTPGILVLVTEAFRAGEASAVAPFQYLRLPVLAATGWALYGEAPDGLAWLGAGVILAGALLVSLAEARARR
ncbi:DMT family transporter [Pseudoroseomonas cervicalis]|uniref:Putative membrane protein n=1 Tax=Pseudoroseomonas cervicalis ATCC 49957 TaxID=525371 RepID=D5RSY6_9PROT|nr:DMT family transporter [Pseudoroseomonas cervicalis]EFH09585.1 putative membrane protein [Pseudoroseomonas cervicalis ATCC 49957]